MVSSWSSKQRECLEARRAPPDRECRRDDGVDAETGDEAARAWMEVRTGEVLGEEIVERVPVEAVRGRICSRLLQSCSCCCCRRRYFCSV